MRQFLSSKASLGALGHGQGQGHGSIQKLDQLVSGIDRSSLMSAAASASASHPMVESRIGTANGNTPLGNFLLPLYALLDPLLSSQIPFDCSCCRFRSSPLDPLLTLFEYHV